MFDVCLGGYACGRDLTHAVVGQVSSLLESSMATSRNGMCRKSPI